MGWREEITAALNEWVAVEGGAGKQPRWHRIGRAVRAGDAGRYAVDVRGSDIGPDQLDSLKLSGPEKNDVESKGFSVAETAQSGSLLTVRVAEFADIPDPYLWVLRQPPTFLIEALRDGISGLGEAPLANALAGGLIGGDPARAPDPPGFHPAQGDAYRVCLGSGVWLVWGPPGTGKTTVLKRAIGDLIGQGKRILLVSATNIAVDNALLGVVRDRQHARGDIVRVGPPQLREVAENPEVSLPLLVRERLTDTEARRAALESRLVEIRATANELAAVEAGLAGFDAPAYFAALRTLQTPGADLTGAEENLAHWKSVLQDLTDEQRDVLSAAEAAGQRVTEAAESREWWGQVDGMYAEALRVEEAATQREAAALLAEQEWIEARDAAAEIEGRGRMAKWRSRQAMEAAQAARQTAQDHFEQLRAHAAAARDIADRRGHQLKSQANDMAVTIPLSEVEIGRRDDDFRDVQTQVRNVQEQLGHARGRVASAENAMRRANEAHALTTEAQRRGWPARHARAESLRLAATADERQRLGLEQQYKQVQEEYERLARNAQGEIIKSAKLVATTLARFRTNKSVFEGPYDVVLVDEAGAATLPEVLLATAKATTAAVLLGDFMQLGPVISPELKNKHRPDIKKWLLPDVFQHCAIDDPAAAMNHQACVTLVEQHRFGPAVTSLANALAYDGVLEAGPQARTQRPAGDPEIVIVDTDDLHELARAHLTGNRKGWWPAGSLIARALVDLHRDDGEEAGIVTPYAVQAEATLEALRDIEGSGRPLADVGTAHRFQGREFPIVIVDTVEGEDSRELWLAHASRRPDANSWQRDGVRLFNVAATRVQTRLYIVGSWQRISNSPAGTAFAHLAALVNTPGVRRLQAKQLITPPEAHGPHLGEFGSRLAEVLARHVEVRDIDDERSFYETFVHAMRAARTSIWLWAPWVANRVRSILPELHEATQRGVRVTVFVRDPSDQLQRRMTELVDDLRDVVHTVVPINVMHQKIVVIDEHVVMLGSLNTLSQSWTREVMLTMRGSHFARKVLAHENAEMFANPPKCGRCKGGAIEIRRRRNGNWFWRCYDDDCKASQGGKSWNQEFRLGFGAGRRQ